MGKLVVLKAFDCEGVSYKPGQEIGDDFPPGSVAGCVRSGWIGEPPAKPEPVVEPEPKADKAPAEPPPVAEEKEPKSRRRRGK